MTKYPDSACEAHRNVETSEPVCIVCLQQEMEKIMNRILDDIGDFDPCAPMFQGEQKAMKIELDDPVLDATDPHTRLFLLAEHWKKRASEAEESLRRIIARINEENGPTFMGEPVIPATAPCVWVSDDESGGLYETSCGQAFTLNDGTPEENGMLYCYHCGKPLEVESVESDEPQTDVQATAGGLTQTAIES